MLEVNKIYHGDCLNVLKTFPDNSIDSCVTDPPYGISFMNKHWDYQIPSVEIWEQVLRVLKPGGHLLCACGTRTQHRMTVNIEDAGFEIRDVITWHYGSGFPKSFDISKAIDRAAGVERDVTKEGITKAHELSGKFDQAGSQERERRDNPVTDAAKQWEGWGTALKPATEFWTLARKPIEENTVAENVLKHGTGGLNIDGSRIYVDENDPNHRETKPSKSGDTSMFNIGGINYGQNDKGRFPANVIFDEFTGKMLDEQGVEKGIHSAGAGRIKIVESRCNASSYHIDGIKEMNRYEDNGNISASRFFYCPKADNFERNKGLKGFEGKQTNDGRNELPDNAFQRGQSIRNNHHPCVKPIDLMRYLVKLITPKHGICVDPFCGSGTTLIGCKLELIKYIGIDTNEEYCKIAEARVAAWNPEKYIEQTLF